MQTSGTMMRPVASSFPLQIALNLSIYFAPVWWALTFSLLIYKGTALPYTPLALGMEITVTFIMWFLQYWAVRLGKRGNLTEQTATLGIAVALMIFNIGGCFYYIFGQTYVMRIDRGFSITFLVLNGLNFILSVFAMQGFGGEPAPVAGSAASGQAVAQQQQLQQTGGATNQQQQQMFQQQQQQMMQQQQQHQQQQQAAMMLAQQQQQQQQAGGAAPPANAAGGLRAELPGVDDSSAPADAQQALIEEQMRAQQQWAAQQGHVKAD